MAKSSTENGLDFRPCLELGLRRMKWQDLPEACPHGLYVCLTSDETPESSGNSDQYAKKSHETHH